MEHSDNGSITDVLPLMDYLLHHLETLKDGLSKAKQNPLLPAVEDAWRKLDHYYQETDKSSVYSSAVILDPRLKLGFLQRKWAEHLNWIESAKKSTERRYQEYINKYSDSITTSTTDSQSIDIFDTFKFGEMFQQDVHDELTDYLSLPSAAQTADPVKWWIDHSVRFPILSRLALDILAIPATSAEAERAFSRYICFLRKLMLIEFSAKHLITDSRNRLQCDIISMCQSMRTWIHGQHFAKEWNGIELTDEDYPMSE
jgi:hypothetical protein